jgi:hypothetical protein
MSKIEVDIVGLQTFQAQVTTLKDVLGTEIAGAAVDAFRPEERPYLGNYNRLLATSEFLRTPPRISSARPRP